MNELHVDKDFWDLAFRLGYSPAVNFRHSYLTLENLPHGPKVDRFQCG
jgi:hypothetical protein